MVETINKPDKKGDGKSYVDISLADSKPLVVKEEANGTKRVIFLKGTYPFAFRIWDVSDEDYERYLSGETIPLEIKSYNLEMAPLREVTVKKTSVKEPGRYFKSDLIARIDDAGDLVLDGYDFGDFCEEFWGNDDYEYWLTVESRYKDTVLLWLIKERFTTDSEFKEWLWERGIPSKFDNWV